MASVEAASEGLRSLQRGCELFEVVGRSVVGPSHLASGQPCQDFFAAEIGQDWAVAVVSDGAGSAKRALDGATIVSEEICQALASYLKQLNTAHDGPTITSCWWVEGILIGAIERARKRCVLVGGIGEQLRSFHATVVGSVLVDGDGVLFHIGDGGASAHRMTAEGIETISFSEPENGEYANQTFFFTEGWWRQHLRLTRISGKVDAIWLMTDGAYELMVLRPEKRLRELTVKEINRLMFVEAAANKHDVLAAILSSRQAVERNDDDKTLVIVRRR
jgi:hypothetical protein